MSIFGELPVRIDPWRADYGPGIEAETESEEGDIQVVEDIEVRRSL